MLTGLHVDPRPLGSLLPTAKPDGWRKVEGELAGQALAVRVGWGQSHLELDARPHFRARLSWCGRQVEFDCPAGGDEALSCYWGPVALTSLALQGHFTLHASAFASGTQAWVCVGASGVGKSTLAARAEALGQPRLADDLVVLAADGDLAILPGYPQLKLAGAPLAPPLAARRWPLRGLVALRRATKPSLRPLEERQILETLLAHSVAARLFPPPLLQRHLAFMACWARRLAAAKPSRGLALCLAHRPQAAAEAAGRAWQRLESWPAGPS